MIKNIQTSQTTQTGSGRVPSSLNSNPSTFTFGPSVQSDLFNYLKPHQQAIMRPYLRLIKRPYQQKLCISLLDYLEGNGLKELQQPVLRFLQNHIIEVCNLHPLTSSKGLGFRDQGLGKNSLNSHPSSLIHHQPKSIGTVIKQLFPSLKGLSSLNPQL